MANVRREGAIVTENGHVLICRGRTSPDGCHGFLEPKEGRVPARLIHFQRSRIVPASPEKGRRIAYRREDVFRRPSLWSSPSLAWPNDKRKYSTRTGEGSRRPSWSRKTRSRLTCFSSASSGRLSPEDEREVSGRPGAPYSITIAILSDLTDLDKEVKTDQGELPLIGSGLTWMINLSRLRQKVEETSSRFPGSRLELGSFRHAAFGRMLPC